MYGYIIAITISALIGICLGWWLGSRSYSTGVTDGVNMINYLLDKIEEEEEEEEEEESDTGHTPWFHSIDTRVAAEKASKKD